MTEQGRYLAFIDLQIQAIDGGLSTIENLKVCKIHSEIIKVEKHIVELWMKKG